MKSSIKLFICLLFCFIFIQHTLIAQNLTSQEIIGLANKTTVGAITSFFQNKNYSLELKEKYEGQYYGTDEVIKIVYCFNCSYYESLSEDHVSWSTGTNFTSVKIFYNTTKSKIEDFEVWLSNRNVFLSVRKNLPSLGYKYLGEDLTSNSEGILYKYKNNKGIAINVLEKSNGSFIVYIIK